MPPQLIDARSYRVRHIHPTATRASEGSTSTVLGKSYGFTELDLEHQPVGAGLVEGTYSTRLGDSGEFSLTFPNVAGTKGLWREMFSADLCNEFVEIYRDDVLEFVGNIQRIEIDRGVVTVSGPDAWALLRRAYERDQFWTAAPRDVIDHYTQVPVPVVTDEFASLADWSTAAGTPTVENGYAKLDNGDGIFQAFSTLGDYWDVTAYALGTGDGTFQVWIGNTAGSDIQAMIQAVSTIAADGKLAGSLSTDSDGGDTNADAYTSPPSNPFTLQMSRRGRWVSGYINGTLCGFRIADSEAHTQINLAALGNTFLVYSVRVTQLTEFLSTGDDPLTERGDYVLPGDQPTGGLRGRYFNNSDLQGLSSTHRNNRAMSPNRESYSERLDPSMNSASGLTIPVQPGNSGDYFAIRWFGSVYLRGDLGNYTFETTSVVDGIRVWVAKTNWGDQIIDDWTTASGTNTATWTASNYGSEAGWYPIIVELFVDTSAPVFRLQFTPPGTTYTDPGGTSITASTKRTIPSTSLSPLGCYDNRVQGQAHFDLVQGVAQQFGYQITAVPKQLESGEFPCRLVPLLRVGSDTDVVLEVEDDDRNEPLFAPGVTFDGSEQTTTLIGTGAGLPDGSGSQVTSEVTDTDALSSSLFDLQTWVDSADVAFPDLLAARLNAELALRATTWEEVRGTPQAQETLADTWPLTSTLSAMRWRPGDGMRIRVPGIGVEDTEPRQLLQVTRSFQADGRTGTQVAFRQRPRSAAKSIRGRVQAALQAQRSYQRQKVTLVSRLIDEGPLSGALTSYTIINLFPIDQVIKAVVRVQFTTVPGSNNFFIDINGVDRTTELGGPWGVSPLEIDVTAYATQASATDNRIYVRFLNNTAGTVGIDFQLIVEVLR